jgi:hypothetical protein
MAQATFTDVQYQLMRTYRNKNYIADLAFGFDPFMGMLTKRTKKQVVTGGQADIVPVSFDGSGVPSNVEGTTGTATPSQGVQFVVTPVPMTNLAAISALASAAGASGAGAIVKPLKREIDQAIKKVGKVASIELWSDGFPSIGTIPTASASTTLTLGDPDDAVKFSVGDVLVFAAARTSGALRAGSLTVTKVNGNAGTLVVSANTNSVATSGDFIFLANTRITSAAKVGITGVTGWLPATGGTLFGVDQTTDDRLIGMRVASTLSDIEGAFIDGIATCLTFSSNGAKDLTSFMHPRTWAILAKAMQSKTVVVTSIERKGREGDISFTGWRVQTPNGTVEVFTSQFCPKATIFMLNMSTWELVGWGVEFPGIIANQIGAGPPIFMDPATGNISCMVGGFPQLECNAPGWNLTITLT